MNDDVVLLRPPGFLIDGDLVVAAGPSLVDDVPGNADALTEPLSDDQLLVVLIVAAAAGDQQTFQLRAFVHCFLFFSRGGSQRGEGQNQGEGNSIHGCILGAVALKGRSKTLYHSGTILKNDER